MEGGLFRGVQKRGGLTLGGGFFMGAFFPVTAKNSTNIIEIQLISIRISHWIISSYIASLVKQVNNGLRKRFALLPTRVICLFSQHSLVMWAENWRLANICKYTAISSAPHLLGPFVSSEIMIYFSAKTPTSPLFPALFLLFFSASLFVFI